MKKFFEYAVNILLSVLLIVVAAVSFIPVGSVATAVTDRGKKDNAVSLMFNVYWGTDVVYDILGILDKYGAKCTFFLGGCWADDNVECVKAIAKNGHEIGNHGYFHKDMNKLSLRENEREISLCGEFIKKSVGIEMNLFAPPSGAYNSDTLSAAKNLGYTVITWTKDTIDWRDKDKEVIFGRAAKAEGGDLVLMHPMEETRDALPAILEEYRKNGLDVITVSDNIENNT